MGYNISRPRNFMSYYNEKILARTRAHAFVPLTASPINNQPQYSFDAIEDGPIIAGGPLGAYFPEVPANRSAGVLWRQQTVPGLGAIVRRSPSAHNALGFSLSSAVPSLDVNSIIGPIVNSLGPTINGALDTYMPRIQSTVHAAVKSGIDQGVKQASPLLQAELNKGVKQVLPLLEKELEPYKKAGIALGIISAATLAGVITILLKR